MRSELRITSGSRAGQRELFEKAVVTIGRHPSNDFKFHPELDPDVSTRHAELRFTESAATIHDLNSTNGTFVNGERVAGQRALTAGDVISFGKDGPKVEFHAGGLAAEPAATRLAQASPAMGQAAVAGAVGAKQGPLTATRIPAGGPRRDTTMRIAEAVEQQTGKLRTMILGLGALVIVGVGGAWWIGHRDSARAQAQIDALLKRNDSLSAAFDQSVASMRGKVAGLDSALMMSKTEGEKLRAKIRSELSKGDGANVGALTAQLDAVEGRQRALVGAARVDYEAIVAKNAPAMVFVAVQEADGEQVSGSGFNISPSGIVVTNRHVVQNDKGQPARKILVAFEGTTGAWKPAHILNVSKTDELAFIKVDVGGNYPVVAGVAKNTELHVGAPAAIIGYPLGTSTAGMNGDIQKLTPKSTMGVATISKVLAETIQLDAYAAEGSSGSPLFDARGFVVGVVYGGQSESNGRIVYAVPGLKLVQQIPDEAKAIVK